MVVVVEAVVIVALDHLKEHQRMQLMVVLRVQQENEGGGRQECEMCKIVKIIPRVRIF